MEQRVTKIEADVKGIKEDLSVFNTRLTKHGAQIDSLATKQQKMATDLIVIRKDIESIDSGVKRVETIVNKTSDKLEKLSSDRLDDHYKKPMETYKKIIWAVVGVGIGLITTFVLKSLFPMI